MDRHDVFDACFEIGQALKDQPEVQHTFAELIRYITRVEKVLDTHHLWDEVD